MAIEVLRIDGVSTIQQNLANAMNEEWVDMKIYILDDEQTSINQMEKYIKEYAEKGYQLRNKTSGSQGIGKMGLDIDKKEPKKYREGIRQGEKNARRYIAKLFEKDLKAEINGKVTKNKEKSYLKFYKYINIIEEENE